MTDRRNQGTQAPRASMALIRGAGLAAALLSMAAIGAAAAVAPAAAPAPIAAQLAAAHLPEPLVATGPTSAAEDAALLAAVARYENRAHPDDFSALTGFLAAHPKSGWRVAVLADLGIVYVHYGYFSRALDAWTAAWHGGKDATAPRARALVDRAVGELLRLDIAFGYRDRLAALLQEIGNRPLAGPANVMLRDAKQTLWVMQTDPKHLYLCGPMALKMLLLALHASDQQVNFLNWARADGPQGTNLVEVAALAKRVNVSLVPVFRRPGEPVPVPSIVHWKVGHFAAIVGAKGGRFEVRDPTFGRQSLWVTKAALDAEASGYFLTPAKAVPGTGWRQVAAAEAGRVWGAGYTSGDPPDNGGDDTNPADPPDCQEGMCVYNINEAAVGLTLTDWPVGYAPPKGPSARVMINYNQQEASQPANFNFFNVSQKWTFNWLTYIQDDPTSPGTNVSRYLPGGGADVYAGYDSSNRTFAPEADDASVLVLEKTSPVTYQRLLRDGTVEIYAESNGSAIFPRDIFLTKIVDPQGNTLTLNYGKTGGQIRLVALTDATGRKTKFFYGSRVSPLLITKITDPFGRSAELTYDGSGRLSSITDVIGLTSKFSYDSSSLVDKLNTPYGTTQFTFGGSGNRWFVNIIDPLKYGEREETFQPAPVPPFEPSYDVPQGMTGLENQYLQYRDSFHWDKHQYAAAGCKPNGGCSYADARLTHFTHDASNPSLEWDTVESKKQPLENRVWYTYEGQPNGALIAGTYDLPTAIGRVLDNGQTELTQIAYNAAGNPTDLMDPVGRQTTLTYEANQIDVEAVVQATAGGPQTIAKFTYNDQHRPVTYTDAAGQTTRFTYNSAGQRTSLTNPLLQRTSYEYDGTGDLVKIVNANGKLAASFSYDSANRVASYTDSQDWTVKYDYDAADRLTKATYPDATSDDYIYDKLDLASYKDRHGHVWSYVHDPDRRLTAVTDPLGHKTTYNYYEDGTLKSLTDPNGHTTSWDIDIEGRPTAKIYADGTATTYQYELTTSRLKSVTDALGQTRNYSYALDDRVASIAYQNAVNPTSAAGFTYDPYFPRLVSMTDGTGSTSYSYVAVGKLGALRLESESEPLPNGKIGYSYDPLGRVVTRTVGGASPETFQYDKIDRLIGHTDALGSFALGYLGETGQPTERQLTGDSIATKWSYLPNTGDRRLAGIVNTPGREYKYVTTADDLITRITEAKPGKVQQSWSLRYDGDNRVTRADASVAGKYGYAFDPAGNITRLTEPSGTEALTYNDVNKLTNAGFVYDLDGDLLSDGTRDYSWDAANRLVAITYKGHPGQKTGFEYDGLDRRAVITETPASGKATTYDYIWCGTRICQQRVGASAVARLYYPEGETIPAEKALFYYGPDQLGSARDVSEISPLVSALGQAYDYDPYGNTITAPTGKTIDFRYAGMLYHANSGLYLTQYRAYDPRTGRWLARDPLGEFPARLAGAGSTFSATFLDASEQLASTRAILSQSTLFSMKPGNGFDPYGGITQFSMIKPLADFRNADAVLPNAVGLYPILFRAYDPRSGQLPALGPIEETGGQNLYAYVDGDPVNAVDLAGLDGTSCPYDPCHGLTGWDCINYLWHQSNPGQKAFWDPPGGYVPPPFPKP